MGKFCTFLSFISLVFLKNSLSTIIIIIRSIIRTIIIIICTAELAGFVLARLVLGGDAVGLLLVLVDLQKQLRAGSGQATVGRRLIRG